MQVGGTVPRVIMRAIKLDKTGLYSTRASKCHVNFSRKRESGDGGSTLMGVARIRAWSWYRFNIAHEAVRIFILRFNDSTRLRAKCTMKIADLMRETNS